jgi:hypothetical protein
LRFLVSQWVKRIGGEAAASSDDEGTASDFAAKPTAIVHLHPWLQGCNRENEQATGRIDTQDIQGNGAAEAKLGTGCDIAKWG